MSENDSVVPQKKDKALVKRPGFNELLPRDFKLVAMAPQVLAEQRKVWADRHYTFSQAHDRAKNMHPSDPVEKGKRLRALSKLVLTGAELMTADRYDPLENYREKMGLIAQRELLMNRLLTELSFENGMAVFGKKYQDMADINKDYPQLTRTEITLLSLVDKAPHTFLEIGRPAEYQPQSKNESDCHFIPMIAGASVNGLMFINDTINPNRVYAQDVYSQLGMVGASESSTEVVSYKPSVKKIIDELLPLVMTNYRLHERLWITADSALPDGISKLDRIAISRTLGHDPDMPIAQAIKNLTREQLAEFHKQQKKVDRRVGKNVLVDLQAGRVLDSAEMIKLFGLIHEIPNQMIDGDNPFEGFFAPFGPGILFSDASGKAASYTPYHPHHLRYAMQGLHAEKVDAKKDNRTMAIIFNQLARQAEGLAMSDAEKTGDDPSVLEGIKVDMKLKYDIDLDICPQVRISSISLNDFSASEGRTMAVEPTYKFGVGEATQILKVFGLLPPELLKGIKTVKKETSDLIQFDDLLKGAEFLGNLRPIDGIMTLYQDPSLPFVESTPELQALRAFTIVHEAAHNVWFNLSEDEQNSWREISWNSNGEPKIPITEFLTMYSHTEDEAEDFSDHFASFVLHGPEFRAKAADVKSLAEKYQQIKTIISKYTGKALEYPQISQGTIGEITGAVSAQIVGLSAQEVMDMERLAKEREDVIARQAREKIEVNLDENSVSDVIDDEELATLSGPATTIEQIDQRITDSVAIDLKRNSILTLRDFFTGSMSDIKATKLAKRIYQLIEEDELGEAMKIARGRINDQEEWKDFQEQMDQIKTFLDGGESPEG